MNLNHAKQTATGDKAILVENVLQEQDAQTCVAAMDTMALVADHQSFRAGLERIGAKKTAA